MTKVFIGGSRAVNRLNPLVQARTDNVINQHFTVLIGDANGADKAIQRYLASKGYNNVIVYCMERKCRNNIGQWKTKRVEAGKDKRGFEYYAAKDIEMAKDASYGFMIWDGRSKGTLNNILNLLKLDKKVLVYFVPTSNCYTVTSYRDLLDLLGKCDEDARQNFEKYFSLAELTVLQPVGRISTA